MAEAFTIGTGERKQLRTSLFGTSLDILYGGMSAENTFSIGLLLSKSYQGHGLNLFFPKKSTYIMLDKKKYYVLNVTPESITLQLSE
ncbi:hypothetical protein [Methanolobus psychrotolerans]|uniref:hypothetical protein n=1 Tax=Methanolobus psychrotolerans TaxID=1874706 RepID=UPI000B917630|nr:hypothetical protein [Methanolobus psychrotolerans]